MQNDATQPFPVQLFTVRGTAQMLGCHPDTVRSLILEGQLEAYNLSCGVMRRTGKTALPRIRISGESIEALLNATRIRSVPQEAHEMVKDHIRTTDFRREIARLRKQIGG